MTEDTLVIQYGSSEEVIDFMLQVVCNVDISNPVEELSLESAIDFEWTGSELKDEEEVSIYLMNFHDIGFTNKRYQDLFAVKIDSATFRFESETFRTEKLTSNEFARLAIE